MIVGQENLQKELDKILTIFKASEAEIRPHFFLTGSSGSGKSYTIQNLALKHELNFIEINAAQLTKEGTSGNSLSKALSPLLNAGNKLTIVFLDEFDKLFISGNSNDSQAHETTTGVQNELLKVLESPVTAVFGDYGKYVNASTKNCLFIFAGAFNNEDDIDLDRLRELGVKTELLGRVGLIYNTCKLTLDNLFTILENSQLLEKYLTLFPKTNKERVLDILKTHIANNYENNSLGARYINTLINQYFIKGGKIEDEVKKISFTKTLELE